MNLKIFGISIPLFLLVIVIIRTISRLREDQEQERINKLSNEEREKYLKDTKTFLERESTRPRTVFEKLASIVFIGILGILGIGGLACLIYLLLNN